MNRGILKLAQAKQWSCQFFNGYFHQDKVSDININQYTNNHNSDIILKKKGGLIISLSNNQSGGFDIEESIGFLLSKCHQKAFQIFREKLSLHNLTPPQFAALAFLWKKDGQSQIQLGTAMEMDRTTISGVIDRLENQGLVNRRHDPEDRRVFMIYLTEAGRELENTLPLLSLEANTEVTLNLSVKEKATVLALLKKLRGELKC